MQIQRKNSAKLTFTSFSEKCEKWLKLKIGERQKLLKLQPWWFERKASCSESTKINGNVKITNVEKIDKNFEKQTLQIQNKLL